MTMAAPSWGRFGTSEVAMMRKMISLVALASATLLLGACASGMTRAERLSLYEAHAGEPLSKINYFSPQGWEEVDDNHILVTFRPSEVYLMRLNGPCLDYDNGSAAMLISTSTGGWVQQKFDRVSFGGGMSCRIEEIRAVDMPAVRAARSAQQASI
jgi:hypothetical protein